MRLRTVAVAGILAVLTALVASAPPAGAREKPLTVGVAPSPNGYVMYQVPTQIAVSGTPRATIYLKKDDKWFRLGTATPSKPLAYTFQGSGIGTLKVVPSKGQPKIFQTPVYARFSGPGQTPTQYGDIILTDVATYNIFGIANDTVPTGTAPARAGCVLLDVGVKPDRASANFTVNVMSTGANPSTFTGPVIGVAGVPVKGDVVATVIPPPSTRYQAGFVWTCLTNPR